MTNQERLKNWLVKKAGTIDIGLFIDRLKEAQQEELLDIAGYALHDIYLKQENYKVGGEYSTWSFLRKAAWEDAAQYVNRHCKKGE